MTEINKTQALGDEGNVSEEPQAERMTEKTGRTLNDIVRTCSPQLPMKGTNGYGGEQDGTTVELTDIMTFGSRVRMKKIRIGSAWKLHWASYSALNGWSVVLGHWSDADDRDTFIRRED